jgi:pyrimidine-nucleoside phosphorylase
MYDIIEKKKNNQKLTYEEMKYWVMGYVNNEIPDYQVSSLLMAICFNGLDDEELTNLTMIMAESGEQIDLSKIDGKKVDKHSTGGVGDKTTLIVAPIAAACGCKVAKMSGKGLGFTGGTADKLEAIEGYKINIPRDEFIEQVNKIGISLISQSGNLTPADKKIYALRDSINCVESIPLIASSIMSKKIAAGAKKIVLDVTCGNGAFMKNREDAEKLAKTMENIGELVGIETKAVITDMEQPIGKYVGNNLEVIEAIEALNGNWQEDIKDVVLLLGSYMIKLAGKGDNLEQNKNQMLKQVENGKALDKFKQLVENQGGDVSYIENTEKFPKAEYILPVTAIKDGTIKSLKAEEVGKISMTLGAGRMCKEDTIDKAVGISLEKKVGDTVKKGEIVAYIYGNNEALAKEAVTKLSKVYEI